MKIGDKIKTFEVKQIINGTAFNYTDSGRKSKYNTTYALLLSENGQERVLEITNKKPNLNDCITWRTTFGSKSRFTDWNGFKAN